MLEFGGSKMEHRFDVIQVGGSWIVTTGGPESKGHLTKDAAEHTAMRAAKDAEGNGHGVEVYVWLHGASRLIYSATSSGVTPS